MIVEAYNGDLVLIPLVQGRFLFNSKSQKGKRQLVLIPLVQGRFLFIGHEG